MFKVLLINKSGPLCIPIDLPRRAPPYQSLDTDVLPPNIRHELVNLDLSLHQL